VDNAIDLRVPGGATVLQFNNQTGTTYTVQNSDFNKLVTFNNANPQAVTLPQAGAGGNFLAGWFTSFKNIGSGYVTITPVTSTIETVQAMVMPPGSDATLYSDGTNYFLLRNGAMGFAPGSDFFCSHAGESFPLANGNATTIVGVADQVITVDITVTQPRIVRRILWRVSTGLAASTMAAGFYDGNQNRIVSTGSQATTAPTIFNITFNPTLLLLPGNYIFAYTCNQSSASLILDGYGQTVAAQGATSPWDQTRFRFGQANNAAVAGNIPPTLGGIIVTNRVWTANIPTMVFEA